MVAPITGQLIFTSIDVLKYTAVESVGFHASPNLGQKSNMSTENFCAEKLHLNQIETNTKILFHSLIPPGDHKTISA